MSLSSGISKAASPSPIFSIFIFLNLLISKATSPSSVFSVFIFLDLPCLCLSGISKVFGRDGKGRVLGLGMGVSKTIIQHSAPYKRALEEEHEANTNLQTQVKRLKEEIDVIKQVLSQGGMQHSSTYYESSSQAQDGSPREEVRTGTDQNNTSHTREGSCRLLSYLRKEITVAVGRVMGLSIDEGGCYRIVIDGILKAGELLLGGDMTFGDLTLGDIISWPIFRTVAD